MGHPHSCAISIDLCIHLNLKKLTLKTWHFFDPGSQRTQFKVFQTLVNCLCLAVLWKIILQEQVYIHICILYKRIYLWIHIHLALECVYEAASPISRGNATSFVNSVAKSYEFIWVQIALEQHWLFQYGWQLIYRC